MLELSGCLLLLLLVLFCCGATLLRLLGLQTFDSVGDKFIVALWVGIFASANIFTFLGFFIPITETTAVLFFGFCCIGFGFREMRDDVRAAMRCCSVLDVVAFGCLTFVLASLTSLGSNDTDTGTYHFQAAYWISQCGITPGLVHLEHRLGFSSSLFSLAAPFVARGSLAKFWSEPQLAIVLTWFLQLLICAKRILQGRSRASDRVFLIHGSLIFPFREIPLATISPNLTLSLFFTVTVWVWLRSFEVASAPEQKRERSLLLLFSAFAASIKVIGWILLCGTVVSLVRGGLKFSSMGKRATVAALAVLLIATLHSTVLSGYPWFPIGLTITVLPWHIEFDRVFRVSEIVREYWSCGLTATCNESFTSQAFAWVERFYASAWLIGCTILGFAYGSIQLRRRELLATELLLYAVAGFGTLAIAVTAPSPTFGLAWFALIPALLLSRRATDPLTPLIIAALSFLVSRLLHTRIAIEVFSIYALSLSYLMFCGSAWNGLRAKASLPTSVFSIVAVVLIAIGLAPDIHFSQYSNVGDSFVQPRAIHDLSQCKFEKKLVGEVEVFTPVKLGPPRENVASCLCWSHELPCSTEIFSELAFLDPESGFCAGFRALNSSQVNPVGNSSK